MRRFLAASTALALCLGVAGVEANPIPGLRGGHPQGGGGGGGGTAFACDGGGSGVCADHSAGQTFVQWPDTLNAGVTDYTKRYRVVRSTAGPINSGNFGTATVIGNYDLPNSGQLFGGNPDNSGGSVFTQANRQANNAANPMSRIPDANLGGLKTLSYATGLQVYTALGSATAYYAVIQTDTSDASPVFIGAVGPIAETAATPQMVQYAHRTTGCGRVTTATTGLPLVFQAHASSSAGGAPANSTQGDYYEEFGDTTQGWQDGAPTSFALVRDGISGCSATYPSLSQGVAGGALVYTDRDTIWAPDGQSTLETLHFGLGLTPNPLVGVANRFYPTTQNKIKAALNWIIAATGADPNKLHMSGVSMGAFAGAIVGTNLTGPRFASVTMGHPVFRYDLFGSGSWPGITWGSWPFRATVAAPAPTLGTIAANVLMNDGTSWFNTYIDLANIWAASPGNDIPFIFFMDTKDDANLSASAPGNWLQIITGVNALQNAHRGMCATFYMGGHTTTSDSMGACNADWLSGAAAIGGVAYSKAQIALNLPYIAFDHSSDNDNPGTATRDATTNIYDGDMVGCWECGHTWNVTSDTVGGFAFVAGDTWMTRSPTVLPSTTLSGSLASSGQATFTVTSTATWLATNGGSTNAYFLIGSGATTEVIFATFSGTTVTVASRATVGTTAKAHSIGDPIVQLVSKPTGPNGGPFASITTNLTPRRLQNFKPGSAPSCTYTPFGGSPTSATVSYLGNGVFTLTGITINSGGNTSVFCS